MAYLYQQTSYELTDRLTLGPSGGESINQSFVFGRNFQLNAVNLRFDYVTISPAEDLKFRIEIRRPFGSDNLLDPDNPIIKYSNWINDESITSHTYNQFVFDGTEIENGTYYFSLVSNIRVRYPIYLSFKKDLAIRGKFVKIENGTGIYREDWSLTIKIDGVWKSSPKPITVYEFDTYTETIIRDES